MRNFTKLLLAAVSSAAIASAAQAADAVIEEAPVVTGYNWSGLYVGAGVGVGATVHGLGLSNILGPLDVDANGLGGEGFFGEVSVGYDYLVSPRFLVGGFADFRFGNIGPEL